ncbi:MAG: tetratricopeptide repeat protein [Pirellulales bacterium]
MATPQLLAEAYAAMDTMRWDDAEAHCRRVLRSDSKCGDAMALLGVLAARRDDNADAVLWMTKAIKQLPRRSDLYVKAAIILRRLNRFDEAELRLRKALMLDPASGLAYFNLGHVLAAKGQHEESLVEFRHAVERSPHRGDVRAALADALHNLQRIDEAADQYEQAVALDDTLAAAWFGLGHIQVSAGKNDRAVESFRRCVELDDEMLLGWFGLGCAELERNDNVSATAAFRRCLALKADYAEAHQNLAQSLFKLGELDDALAHYAQVFSLVGDNSEGRQLKELALRSIAVALPGSSRADHAAVRDARAAWGAMQRTERIALQRRERGEGERLRVGYVSAFFGRDNWMKPVWALVNRHDRTRFRVYLFHDGAFYQTPSDGDAGDKPPTAYQRGDDDVICDITGMDNDAAAARIAAHDIDILVDLNGYSRMDRLAVFARRPALVIAAWFNMFATTGVPWFDYLIGDRHVLRCDEEAYYTERVVRAAGSYLTFSVDYPVPDVQPPPCVERGYVTFGCFASQYKITDEVLAAWAEILRRCPTARLMLKNADLGVMSHQQFFRDKLSALGVATDRIVFAGPQRHFDFLDAYREVDVALDTFPYNGGTTTTEAIWQGVPVVAFDGDRWASRTSATILREAGLSDWVAEDIDGYMRLAASWGDAAQVASRLGELRANMREKLRGASVCDTAVFARSIEGLYEQMWARHVADATTP